ncbi:glycosyltransferase family 39 protein [Maioricimonas rarisocia]|uniref:glycosyltransferase family 39 protein n=1 Tax=Maioricimonas rarisocia TaxID=2528026 RepID=UPI0018D231DC|nr:glycosyltransferase family 39 protein [Maioricimonas rarisocia]
MSASAAPTSFGPNTRRAVWLGIILLAGLLLRATGLDARSLWYDEALSSATIRFDWTEIIVRRATAGSVHPPLYYLLLKAWSRAFGSSDAALRSLSLVAGLCGIAGMYLLARELSLLGHAGDQASGRVGLWAAFLMALHPMQILTSQQVRGYAVGTALLIWSNWLLVRALRGEGRSLTAQWCLWGTLTTLFCYTNNLAVLSVAAQVVFAVLYLGGTKLFSSRDSSAVGAVAGEEPDRKVAASAPDLRAQVSAAACGLSIVAVAWGLPWMSRVASQASTVRTTQAIVRPFRVKQIPQEIHRAIVSSWAQKRSWRNLSIWPTTALMAAVFLYLAFRGGWPGWYLICTSILPVVVIVLFSTVSARSIVHTRYLTFVQPIWIAAVAYTVFRHRRCLEQTIVAAWLVAVLLSLCHDSWSEIGPGHNPGMRAAVQHVSQNLESGDLVLARERHVFFGMRHYFDEAALPLLLVDQPDPQKLRAGTELRTSELITPDGVLKHEPSRVWIFSTVAYSAPQRADFEVPVCWELADIEVFEQDYFWEGTVTVRRYIVPPGNVSCQSQEAPTESE